MKRVSTNSHPSKRRQVRHSRVRSRILGTATKPRLSVYRGLKAITAQLIDDTTGKTLVYVSSHKLKKAAVEGKTTKVAAAYSVGQKLAEMAKEKKISTVVFDRGGYRYHGRVAAVAEGARAGGLQL